MKIQKFMVRFYLISALWLIVTFTVDGRTRLTTDGSLELPSVPVELRIPVERADYVVSHFWDAMDWGDTVLGRKQVWLEQQLVNFISVIPHAHHDSVSHAVNAFMTAAQTDIETYRLLSELAMGYLFNADSPMRNDEYYIMFLENESRAQVLSDGERARAEWMLGELNKNRVGNKVKDFWFTLRDGTSMKLSDINSDTDVLLLFYDPDCSTCHVTMAELETKPCNLTVVAVCVEGERDIWLTDAMKLPANWIVGYPSEPLDELYALLEIPTMILLDSDLKVKKTNVKLIDLK